MLRASWRVVSVLIIAAVFPLLVSAQPTQQMRDRDPDLEGSKKLAAELQQANFHYGAWYLLSRIRIADAGYSDTASLPAGSQSGGVSLSVEAPQRAYYVPHKKVILTLEGTPGYSFFDTRDNERQTQFNYRLRGDAHFLFNHLYLDTYAMREDQLAAHVADINRLATVRNDEVGVAGEAKYSSRTSALFSVRLRDLEYPGDRFQPQGIAVNFLDRRETNARLSLMHKTFPLTSLFVAGERSNYDFDTDMTRNSTRTYYGAGAIWNPGRSTVRIEAGPLKLDFDDPSQKDYSGIAGSLQATRTAGRQSYNFRVDRDLGFALFTANDYYISTAAHAAVSRSITRRATFRVQSTVERDDYDVPVFGRKRRDTISFSSVGFLYAFRRLTLGADVGWYERDSTLGGEEDAGIRTVLHLSFTP